jgi:2-dehydro-3-deoxygalactonokinase
VVGLSASPTPAALIAVDWGTSRLRAVLVDANGREIAEAESGDGIGSLQAGAHEAAFERLVAGWPPVPAIVAGMAGSRQGWREAAYVSCPATPAALAAGLLRFETSSGRPVAIIPGVVIASTIRDGDVIRGEETQIVGLLDRAPGFRGVVILPGTHSKWARIETSAIADFQTFLTGELFDLLARQSFLRHSVADDGRDLSESPGFTLAVQRTAEAGLPFLSAIFSVRVRQLLNNVDRTDNLAYLSGLVIGGEIAAGRASGHLELGMEPKIIGTRSLARAYRKAFEVLGYKTGTLDGKDMVVAGLVHLARKTGMLPKVSK